MEFFSSASDFSVVSSLAQMRSQSCSCQWGTMSRPSVPYAHLSGQSNGPAVDVHHAIREVVSVVVHADALRGRVCLGRRMVRAELCVLAEDACLARHILVAFDLSGAAWIAGLVFSRLPFPPQDLVDVGARWCVVEAGMVIAVVRLVLLLRLVRLVRLVLVRLVLALGVVLVHGWRVGVLLL